MHFVQLLTIASIALTASATRIVRRPLVNT